MGLSETQALKSKGLRQLLYVCLRVTINRETQADKSSTTRSYSTQGRDDLTLRVKVDTLN